MDKSHPIMMILRSLRRVAAVGLMGLLIAGSVIACGGLTDPSQPTPTRTLTPLEEIIFQLSPTTAPTSTPRLYFTSTPDAALIPSATAFARACPGGKLLVTASVPGDDKPRPYLVCDDGSGFVPWGQDPGFAPALSPQQDRIAFAGYDGMLHITDVDGMLLDTIEPEVSARSMSWSPDGEYLATAGFGNEVQTIHLKTNTLTKIAVPSNFDDPDPGGYRYGWFRSVAWSPGGDRLALGSYDGMLVMMDVQCDEATHQCSGGDARKTATKIASVPVLWSPGGGELLAFCRGDAREEAYAACLIDVDGNIVRRFPGQDGVDPVWSPDGTKLAFVSQRLVGKPRVMILTLEDGSLVSLTGKTGLVPESGFSGVWLP